MDQLIGAFIVGGAVIAAIIVLNIYTSRQRARMTPEQQHAEDLAVDRESQNL